MRFCFDVHFLARTALFASMAVDQVQSGLLYYPEEGLASNGIACHIYVYNTHIIKEASIFSYAA